MGRTSARERFPLRVGNARSHTPTRKEDTAGVKGLHVLVFRLLLFLLLRRLLVFRLFVFRLLVGLLVLGRLLVFRRLLVLHRRLLVVGLLLAVGDREHGPVRPIDHHARQAIAD